MKGCLDSVEVCSNCGRLMTSPGCWLEDEDRWIHSAPRQIQHDHDGEGQHVGCPACHAEAS